MIASERDALAGSIETAETRRRAAADALATGETALRQADTAARDAERAAGDSREARARAEARAEAAIEGVSLAEERISEAQDVTPAALLESLEADPDKMPPAETVETEVAR